MDGMNDFVQIVQSVGFPMFVAIFYMVKGTQDTKAMTEALGGLKEAISKMQLTIEQQSKDKE